MDEASADGSLEEYDQAFLSALEMVLTEIQRRIKIK